MELLKIKPKKKVAKVAKKKKKPRNVKHHITISDAENTQLIRVCKKDGTTAGKLIKSILREYLKTRSSKINDEIAENQLNLFKNPKPVQYKIGD
jgi:DNA polymerase III psi subunit